MTKLSHPIPVLRIFDETKTREFYLEWLGFAIDWDHRFGDDFPIYLQVSNGNCVLHLSEHHGDATPGGQVRILCNDIDGLAALLRDKPYKHAKPSDPQQKPWGTRELTLTDPFGNRLTFYSPVG